MNQPAVPAQHPAGPVDEIARLRPDAERALQKAGVVAVRHEADVLAVGLAGVPEAVRGGERAHLGLAQAAEREQRVRQLLLRHRVQHIGLVLGGVPGFFQQPAPAFGVALHPRVVPGRDLVHPHQSGALQQPAELDVPVAVDAGVRRLAAAVSLREARDHVAPELPAEIEHVVLDAEAGGDAARVLHVRQRAAGAFPFQPGLLVAEKPQRRARDLVPLLQQQQGRDGAVHPAAHGDHHFFTHQNVPSTISIPGGRFYHRNFLFFIPSQTKL